MHHDPTSVTRRAVLVGASATVAGCVGTGDSDGGDGDDGTRDGDGSTSGTDLPTTGEVDQVGGLSLRSPAFDDGGRIPEKYGYEAENVNSPLEVGNVPDDAGSLALVVDDPDADSVAGEVWTHWVVWNVPPDTTSIPEGWDPDGAEEGTNDYDEVGYGGPNPPEGEHRYRFKLFAADATFDLASGTGTQELGEAIDGHVLAATQLDGTYG